MKIKNSAINRLTIRYLKANRKRNIVLLVAIILTTFMITAVLSTALGMENEFRLQRIRFAGSVAHAQFSSPTVAQFERLSALYYVEDYGVRQRIAQVESQMGEPPLLGQVSVAHWNESSFRMHLSAWVNVVGSYPVAENEIMASRWVLEQLGIENPEIGMTIPLTFMLIDDNALQERMMVLTGFYTSAHELMTNNAYVLVSDDFLEQLDMMPYLEHQTVDILFVNEDEVSEDANRLSRNLGIEFEQDFQIKNSFLVDSYQEVITIVSVSLFILLLMFTGFLLIYSVFHTSIIKDIRFYGSLKTLGAMKKQIRHLLVRQLVYLSFIGIPIGLLLGGMVSFILIPLMIGENEQNIIVYFSPFVYGGAILFTLTTVLISVVAPVKKITKLSAIETIKYSGEISASGNGKKKVGGKLHKMALRNIFRDRKRAAVVILSLFLGLSIFMTTTIITSSLNLDAYLAHHAEHLFGYGDFSIQHEQISWITRPLNGGLVEQISSLERVERVQIVSFQRGISVPSDPMFAQHLEANITWWEEFLEQPYFFRDGENGEIALSTDMFAIEGAELQLLDDSFDIEAFERGEFIVIATDFYEDFIDVEVINGDFWSTYPGGSNEIVESFSIPLGGTIPWQAFRWENDISEAPKMLVSHAFLNSFKDDPLIIEILINAYASEELALYDELTNLIMNREDARINSRIELAQIFQTSRTMMFILGGSIAAVLGSMGVLNFVNALSMSIIARKLEFATLESIGMTKKQVKKMLIYEGLWYAFLTLVFVFSLGSAISIGFYNLVNQTLWSDFLIFTYPWLLMIIITFIIIFLCAIIPVIFYHTQSKQSIVDKLREDG